MVEEPDEEQTLEILKELRPYYEEHHKVKISDEALSAAVSLSTRYINDRFQPDKALDLIDEASSRVLMRSFGRNSVRTGESEEIIRLRKETEKAILEGDMELAALMRKEQLALQEKEERHARRRKSAGVERKVQEEDVAAAVSAWTGIPLERIAEKEPRSCHRH